MKSATSWASSGSLIRALFTSIRTCCRSTPQGIAAMEAAVAAFDIACTNSHHTGTTALFPFNVLNEVFQPVSAGLGTEY
ncbi:hypothetical protein ALO83_103245 [Pseudomonas cannabina pv. alisalensis]|nr:hypothetical protein ALO83_103245 [Pseudomonas cannabina pv. alisalensis]RMP90657.1 hypothetical protein ALQ13_102571 [Pseudomonas savastanoi pv. glycinea]